MSSNDYNKFLALIKEANNDDNKELLKKIKKELLTKFGFDDNDVEILIKKFRYNV